MLRRIKSFGRTLRNEIEIYGRILNHPRTPRLARWLLWCALGYLVSPIDLIPDFLPGLGHVDDLFIVPLLVIFALRLIPDDVVAECRAQFPDPNRPPT